MNKERNTVVDLQDNPLLLKGTGWDLKGQMEMIKSDAAETPEVSLWKQKTIEKTKSDLEGLYFEYLIKSRVLPFELSISDDNITCPKYGNKKLVDIVSADERDGTIRRSMETLSNALLNASDGDTYVLISPPGWSGYDGVRYPVTQIYYYQKQGSEIRSLTLVSPETTLDYAEILKDRLTNQQSIKASTEEQRVLDLTSNLLSFKYLEPHDIVYSLEKITKTPLPQMYESLNNLPEIDTGVQECINELETFIKEKIHDTSTESQTKLMYKIGQTVLDMKSVLTRGRKPTTREEYAQSYIDFSQDDGCNGGGTIYGRNKENGVEEEFPNWGVCRLGEFCISEHKGQEQSLGLCMICKTCDKAFSSGKTLEQIKAMSSQNIEAKNENLENSGGSLFVSAAFFFISSLFST